MFKLFYEVLEPLMDDEADIGGGELEEEVQGEEEAPIEEEKQPEEDKIPKAVFLQQKKELKELKKQLRELTEREQDSTTKSTIEKAIAKMSGKYDEDFVDVMREFAQSLITSIPKPDKFTEEVMEDIRDLGQDALKYKDEIIAKVKKFKKAGEELSVEEAYELVRVKRPHEDKIKEEQKELVNRRKSKEPTGSGGSMSSEKYNLTDKDQSALKQLQRLYPEAGWDAKKYHETMKRHI